MNLGKKCNGFLKTAIRSVDEEGLKITHTINTKALDRYYTCVLPKGADVKHFLNNAVVLWSHNMDEATPKIPIGRCIDLDIREDEIIATTEFNKNDPLAVKVFNAYRDGFLHAWSIGFMPIGYTEITPANREEINSQYKLDVTPEQLEEAGYFGAYVVHKWELLEYSAVPVPGNPEALSANKVDSFKRELVKRGLVNEADVDKIDLAKSKKEEKEEYVCECLDCDEEVTSKEHCKDIKYPKCGGEMRRKDRTGTGKDAEVETRDAEEVSKEVKEEVKEEKKEVKEEVKTEVKEEEVKEESKAEVKEEVKEEEVKEKDAEELKTEVKEDEVKVDEVKEEVKEEVKTEEEEPANFASIIKDLIQKNKELSDRLEATESKLAELANVNTKVEVIQKSLDVDNIDKIREASQKRKCNSESWFSNFLKQ